MSNVTWFLIFHTIDIHIFTEHNWSGSGQNYRWTEAEVEVAKGWGTIYKRYEPYKKQAHNSNPLIPLGMI